VTSMARRILITGGARSGKSQYAEERAKEIGARRVYIATAESRDQEMARRIAEHRRRRGHEWTTVEEPIELAKALLQQRSITDCAVVDCLTLWVSNLLLQCGAHAVNEKVDELVEQLPLLDFHIYLVTNEVGSAVVPDNAVAREFRDLMGWTNQRVAQAADEVVLMVTGIPMVVKKALCS
jgi:adenosylcobinamide kinase/adenosylcobinamide-phosphate guanylyltransferase